MKIEQYNIYLADLQPAFGSGPGKIRPVVVVQTDMLNEAGHKSTIICPITSRVIDDKLAFPLRINLDRKITGLDVDSDILVDQIRSIDNKRFIKKIGRLTPRYSEKLAINLKIILFE